MATSKSSNSSAAGDKKAPTGHSAGLVQESAQQIWLAGLGAFAKAQEEGSKAFQSLVKEGMSLQSQTKAAAEEKLAEATPSRPSGACGQAKIATRQRARVV